VADELLFTVDSSKATPAVQITLADAGLKEREHLQEWVIGHPEILGAGVMIVTFEFDRWKTTSGPPPQDRLDILGLDETGHLVVAELKRGVAPDSVEMQAIKYAAMVSRFSLEALADRHAKYLSGRGQPCSSEEALGLLLAHAEEITGETLKQPRIVLLAESYPKVISAVAVWLGEMGVEFSLMQYQAYKTANELLLSVSQIYPPLRDLEDFMVTPKAAEALAAVATKKRTQDTSAVRRLVEAGTLEDGTELWLQIRKEVTEEVRNAVEEWLGQNPERGKATWQNLAKAPLVWAWDNKEYTPTGLIRHILLEVADIDRSVQGTKWWVDAEGQDLVELSASGRPAQYLAFWTRFLERIHAEHPNWSNSRFPQTSSWFDMPSPIKGTKFSISFARGERLRSELYIDSGNGDENLKLFKLIESKRSQIDGDFDGELEWDPLPTRQACRIAEYGKGDVSNDGEHDAYIDWFFDSTQRLRDALSAAGYGLTT
jgi:hypothetical protein